MDEVKTTNDIDLALDATTGTPLGNGTVAIWYEFEGMYGIYVKGGTNFLGENLWLLQMTSLTLDGLLEKN